MRLFARLLPLLSALLCVLPAWGHEEAAELGHHWDIAAYRSEMWFQLLIMGTVIALYVAGIFAYRHWKRRGRTLG